MFGGAVFAHRRQRWYISVGTQLRKTLVEIVDSDRMSVQTQMHPPPSVVWPLPISQLSRTASCRNPGRLKCERRPVMVIRGISQVARRLLRFDNPVRARRGADDARTPQCARESVKTTVRRLVRGSPSFHTSVDFWPGVKAGKRSPVAQCAGEPQAERADVPREKPVVP